MRFQQLFSLKLAHVHALLVSINFSNFSNFQHFFQDSGSEVENVTVAHVQEVLEHAYPNGLSVEVIAE